MENQNQLYQWLAILGSGLGTLLLFTSTFMWWEDRDYVSYYVWDRVFIGTPILGLGVIACGVLLLICLLFSIMLILDQTKVSPKMMLLCSILSVLEVIMASILLAVSALVYEAGSAWYYYWYPDVGFYGGFVGGILGVIFYYLSYSGMKKASKIS